MMFECRFTLPLTGRLQGCFTFARVKLLIKHHIDVPTIIIHIGAYLYALCVFEGVTTELASFYPFAQLYNLRLIGRKINKIIALQNGQYIKVIAELPSHSVGARFGR